MKKFTVTFVGSIEIEAQSPNEAIEKLCDNNAAANDKVPGIAPEIIEVLEVTDEI